MQDVFHEAVSELEKGNPMVVATVVHTKGSTPQKPGAKLLRAERRERPWGHSAEDVSRVTSGSPASPAPEARRREPVQRL